MTEESKFILEFFQRINLEKIKELRKSIGDSYFSDFNDESFDLITSYSTNGVSDNASAYEISNDKIKEGSIAVDLQYSKLELSAEFKNNLNDKVFLELLVDYKKSHFIAYLDNSKYKYDIDNGELEIIINKDDKIIEKITDLTKEKIDLINIQYDINIETTLKLLNSIDFVKETYIINNKSQSIQPTL